MPDTYSKNGVWREGCAKRLRRTCHHHPLLACALACVAAISAAAAAWWAALAAILLTAAAAYWLLGRRAACVATAVATFAACGFHAQRQRRQNEAQALTGHIEAAQAVLLEDGESRSRGWVATARMVPGGAKVWWRGRGNPPPSGSQVSADGRFEELPRARNEGEFDTAAWLERQGVAACFIAEKNETTRTGALARWSAWWRHGFREAVTAGLTPDRREARTIRAVVIGETPANDDTLIAAFRDSGSLHVFSVSGLHVMMMAGMAWCFLRAVRVPRRAAVAVLIPFMFGYAWLTGNSAPAVRSAWMGAIFLSAFVFRRKPDMLNALGAVLLAALLWDARIILQPGVQLSYGVVAAIGFGSACLAKFGSAWARPDAFMPEQLLSPWQHRWLNAKRWLVQSTATSLAAFIGSTPLTLWHFGLLTPASIPANLFLAPSVGALLALSLVSAGIRPLAPAVADRLNQLNAIVAKLAYHTASQFARLPGGHFDTRHEGHAALRVFALDRDAGAACFSNSSGAVLIDAGDRHGFRRTVLPALRHFGIAPDAIAFTHADGGHLGDAGEVTAAFPIRQVLMPAAAPRSAAFRAWQTNAVPKIAARPGMRLPLGGSTEPAELEILLAPGDQAPHAAADDRATLLRLHWHGWKFLFLSDAGLATTRKLLERDCRADVVICGRHRSDPLALDDDLLAAIAPRAILLSHSDPAQQATLAAWRVRGIAVWDQTTCGGITITADSHGLHLRGFADSSQLRLER